MIVLPSEVLRREPLGERSVDHAPGLGTEKVGDGLRLVKAVPPDEQSRRNGSAWSVQRAVASVSHSARCCLRSKAAR